MFQPQATIIADSVNVMGDRLTTFVLTYHRMIHSEFMTHRMLSKNSSSSRAIPVEKMIALVESQEVYPLHWGRNCKGMSAKEELEGGALLAAKHWWKAAREDAISRAKTGIEIGLHKQVINRILEPYSTITVICSGTEYQNFFDQRCHPDAQPEMQALAIAMKAEYEESVPMVLQAGEWHLPFLNGEDLRQNIDKEGNKLLKVLVARCARVSYLNHAGFRDINSDIALHDRLLNSKPAHLTPFEHVAQALGKSEKCANFTGFEAYRFQSERDRLLLK
jgi:thymidylate synthase ThyX